MGHRFAQLAFTPSVKALQLQNGSRSAYERMEGGNDTHYRLGEAEREFLASRDSFYMASVSETGWPYVQHRGGPPGFLRVLDERTVGYADFRGNRQYVSAGNLRKNNRVSLIFVDYPRKTRLKLLGEVREISMDEGETMNRLMMPDYSGKVERGFIIDVAAFDWNCPQHITPRFTLEQVRLITDPLEDEIRALRAGESPRTES